MVLCNYESCELLLDVKKKFACVINLKSFNWQELLVHLKSLEYDACCEHQIFLLNCTVFHPLIQKYPIKRAYQKEFLKTFINKIEKLELEVHDRVYEALVNKLFNGNQEVHYRHFVMNDRFLTLKENTCIISQGTTGLFTWQAGIALANWCIQNSDLLKDKRILELGCGIGLTGLALVLSGTEPKSYTFSDCHPLVLQNLRHNIELNITSTNTNTSYPINIGDVEVNVLNIDWDTIDQVKYNVGDVDLILAADVIYDPNLTQSFCSALNFLIGQTDRNAIVACTERDPETFKTFKDLLGKYNLKIVNEFYHSSKSNCSILQYSSETPVIICSIKSCN